MVNADKAANLLLIKKRAFYNTEGQWRYDIYIFITLKYHNGSVIFNQVIPCYPTTFVTFTCMITTRDMVAFISSDWTSLRYGALLYNIHDPVG